MLFALPIYVLQILNCLYNDLAFKQLINGKRLIFNSTTPHAATAEGVAALSL